MVHSLLFCSGGISQWSSKLTTVVSGKCLHQCHRSIQTWQLAHLPHRHLLQVTGKNAQDLLQGLITNDIRHLDDSRCIFAYFLNHLGRVLCDTFIHKVDTNDLLLEVDRSLLPTVTSHLVKHKLRKDVSVNHCEQGQVWSLFTSLDTSSTPPGAQLKEFSDASNFVISNDNRIPIALGRIAIRCATNDSDVLSTVKSQTGEQEIALSNLLDYEAYRFSQGISEGPLDHPKESSFPLECNGDILNGISFFKGCYIGQELTARTYHTGVVRKRIMPLKLEAGTSNWSIDMPLSSSDVKVTKKVGKIRSLCVERQLALALLYVSMARETPSLVNEHGERAQVIVPAWWPKDKKVS